MPAPTELTFCWWNVQDFAHFDPERKRDRAPKSVSEFAEKTRRLVAAFDAMFGEDTPDVIGLCEITSPAAERLQRERFAGHQLVLTDIHRPNRFQVVFLIRSERKLSRRQPLFASDVPKTTRPMGVVAYRGANAAIQFVGCHWPAMSEESSVKYRGRCADRLRSGIYDFLHPTRDVAAPRHVVVLGDFNAEPNSSLFRMQLSTSRDRDYARRRPQSADADVRRVGLYNCGWRLFGDEHPHGTTEPAVRRVGTYYHAKSQQWRTYDQVLVSGGLLTPAPPYFDEGALLVRTDAGNLVGNKPAKFRFADGVGEGVSDHYPLSGRIILG